MHCRSCFEIGRISSHYLKGSRKKRKHQKSIWWARSNDDHQLISKTSHILHKTVKNLLNQVLLFNLLCYLKGHATNPLRSRRKRHLPFKSQIRDFRSINPLIHHHVGQIGMMLLMFQIKKKKNLQIKKI